MILTPASGHAYALSPPSSPRLQMKPMCWVTDLLARNSRRFGAIALMFLTAMSGCRPAGRPGPQRYPVKGAVTLDGEPLTDGRIEFKTISTGYIDGIAVKNGAFAGDAVAGERRVEFSVRKEVPFKGAYLPGIKPPETMVVETLPAHMNVESNFSATVSPTGPNDFQFNLDSKPFR